MRQLAFLASVAVLLAVAPQWANAAPATNIPSVVQVVPDLELTGYYGGYGGYYRPRPYYRPSYRPRYYGGYGYRY